MTALFAVVAWLLHVLLTFAAAPLLASLIRKFQARLLGRIGPPLLQPWRDLLRLLRKGRVVADNTTWLFAAAPFAGAAAILTAASLVPSFSFGMMTAPASDLIVIAGLFGVGRLVAALAAMDTGTAFGGMAASRDMMLAVFAEPALLLVIFNVALMAGTTNLDAAAILMRDGALGAQVSLAPALAALLLVAIAENGRTAEEPETHIEFTTPHAPGVLEYSGSDLALIEYASAIKLLTWFNLILTIFVPFGTASAEAGPIAWAIGLALWFGKVTVLGAMLSLLKTGLAEMRLLRVPKLLGLAILLGFLAAIFLFVGAGFV